MNKEQYKLVGARRSASNQLLWQVPTLAMAAQAFLLTAALSPNSDAINSLVLAIFSLLVGLASVQLMAKLRYLEKIDSELLVQFEKRYSKRGYAVVHGPPRPIGDIKETLIVKLSSYSIWSFILCGFCLLALFAGGSAISKLYRDAPSNKQAHSQPVISSTAPKTAPHR